MSQFDFGNLESPLSGSNFINANLEPWRDALHSLHKGPSTPSYAVAGMMWIDDSASPWVLNIFDGTDNISVGTVDPTTNTFTPSGVSQDAADISVDNSGFQVFNGNDVQEVLGEVDSFADSLGTAASEDVGTSIGNVVQLEDIGGGVAGLPAVDGSQLTGIGSTLGTQVVASGAPTSIAFTAIPPGIKRLILCASGLSTNGTDSVLLQIGQSSGFKTSNYNGSVYDGVDSALTTNGLFDRTSNAAIVRNAIYDMTHMGNNLWALQMISGMSNSGSTRYGACTVQLTDPLDRVRLITQGGTDTIDNGGIVNIYYE